MTNGKSKSRVRGGQRRNGPKPKPKAAEPDPFQSLNYAPQLTSAAAARAGARVPPSPSTPAGLQHHVDRASMMMGAARHLAAQFGMDEMEIARIMMQEMRLQEMQAAQAAAGSNAGAATDTDADADADTHVSAEMAEAMTAIVDSAAAAVEDSSTASSSSAINDDSASHEAPVTADPVAEKDGSNASDKLDSANSDDKNATPSTSSVSISAGPHTQPITFDHLDLIAKPELLGLLRETCTLQQARILVSFASFFICDVIRRYNGSASIPPDTFIDGIREPLLRRAELIMAAHGHMAKEYLQEDVIMPSVTAHAAMLCAHEYMKVPIRDTIMVGRVLKMAVEHESGSKADHKFLEKYIAGWLKEYTKGDGRDVYVHEMDGVKVGDRVYDLQVHFAKARWWPRTIHGTRVLPFGCSDMLDKTKFDEGESKRACLRCKAEFTTTRGWREHLLTTIDHEVYLCCGRQFIDSVAVLEHLVEQHKGGLGAVDAFIQRAYPPMQMWEE